MNTTLDLPDALACEIKQRADRDGRTVDEVVADMLRAGLAPTPTAETGNGQVVTKCLPLIKVRPAPPSDRARLSEQEWCDWLKRVDLQLELERYEKALGHQHVDRVNGGDAPATRPRA